MKKPLNIMLLQGEDVGRHLGCYGDGNARTPHLDQLASQGVRYTQAFSHAPVCAPSRGGMVTGRYPYSLGNHHMRSRLAHAPRTFTQELQDAGYYVNWNTKLDFNFEPREGWRNAQSEWYKQAAPQQPFMVYENFGVTHESRMFPQTEDALISPPPEAEGLQGHDPAEVVVPPHLTDCPEVREQIAKYYNAYSVLDAQVGRRLQWLEDQGLTDSTIVIFLSDHGRGLPREKRWCYDAGIHLPLIVRWPGQLEANTVCSDLVAWVDIAPTLLSLAGASIPQEYQGQVFLGDAPAKPRDCVFAGRDRMDEVFDRVRVVRDHRWHYIRNFAPKLPWCQYQKYMEQQKVMGVMREKWKQGELQGSETVFFQKEKPLEELFDCENDPYCMKNLAGDPACTEILAAMRSRLDQHLDEVEDLAVNTEEDLVADGILTDLVPEYRARQAEAPREWVVGPYPFPMTLRDAQEMGLAENT
ncbi:sulfatase [Kiritimatiellaeota bacterium B1221]|nr:sulfatase [Kiritimatiellaeota bacterium B1221]